MNAACQDRFQETHVRTFITVEDSKVSVRLQSAVGKAASFQTYSQELEGKKEENLNIKKIIHFNLQRFSSPACLRLWQCYSSHAQEIKNIP